MGEAQESGRVTDQPRGPTRQRHGRRSVARSRPSNATIVHPSPAGTETVEPNSLLIRLLAQAPGDFIKTFSNEQVAGLNAALVDADTRYHAIDFRTSLSFFGIPFYVTFLMGREKRSRERLAMEGQTKIHRVAIAHIVLTLLAGLSVMAAVACILYLLKSAVGINIFEGQSFFHEVFFD